MNGKELKLNFIVKTKNTQGQLKVVEIDKVQNVPCDLCIVFLMIRCSSFCFIPYNNYLHKKSLKKIQRIQ